MWDEHAAIAQAIADGDVARVAQMVTRHCQQASANLTHMLAKGVPTPAVQPINSVVP